MKTRRRNIRPGFALVVSLSLMILLTVIAVGLLSLSAIALRSSSQAEAMATARANARLSLMLAIGELQRTAGPDTRVTANADILDRSGNQNNPPVLGVWKSWEGLDHETSGSFAGRPVAPDYTLKEPSSGSADKRFLAWLTSSNYSDPASVPATTQTSSTVALVGQGSVGSSNPDTSQVHLVPTPLSTGNQDGRFAWWIGGENQKARLPKPYKPTASNSTRLRAEWAMIAKSHSVADPGQYGLDSLLTQPDQADKAISLNQADFIDPEQSGTSVAQRRSKEFFHDLSTSSIGLLTNTATGGWRKDMSLLSERWVSKQNDVDLPFFRLTTDPVTDTKAAFAGSESITLYRAGSMFYPWAAPSSSDEEWLQQPVANWSNLMDFITYYKRVSTKDEDNLMNTSSTGVRRATAWAWTDDLGNHYPRHLNKQRLYPVLARLHWVFSHFAEKSQDPADSSKWVYTPKLLVTPAVTMWNPFNVEITMPTNYYVEVKIIPVALSYQVGTAVNATYNCVLHTNNYTRPTSNTPCLLDFDGGAGMYTTFGFGEGLVFKPGETKLLSPDSDDRKTPNGVGGPWGVEHTLLLKPGFRPSGGHLYPVRNSSGVITNQPGDTKLKANISFDTEYTATWGNNGVGTYLEVRTKDPERYMKWIRTGYSATVAQALHPNITGTKTLEVTLDTVANNPKPFLSTIFGPKMATRVRNTVNTQFSTKGLAQSSPFIHFPHRTYRKPNTISTAYHPYTGTGHPVNFGWEYSYATHSSAGIDDNMPNSGPSGNGYIISGVQSANGLPRAVIVDLPSRPLVSLGELNHWDLRFENPCPPFGFNLVGNSDATALLQADAVVNATEKNMAGNLRHDDSYCANHLLFDDWFFSSIAPDPRSFGPDTARSEQRVFTQFLMEETPLANRAYRPIQEDRSLASASSGGAADIYQEYVVNDSESWRKIASRLEVEGLFNVNSTSEMAWRALLGHGRNQRIPYIKHGSSWSIELSPQGDHLVSRSSIAGDAEVTSGMADAFPNASEFVGYRRLDEAFIDELAKEIVKQVRLRGPFLSLSEFVNRQLSSNKGLALAGAIQTALNNLTSGTGSSNPLAVLKQESTPSLAVVPEGASLEDKTGYVFPEAAEGFNSYGVPGWIRQADLLRPIAPMLSSRDDTFTIRGYGDARNSQGAITATATCEAVVRRVRDYVDPMDAADTPGSLSSSANKMFGRRFEIVSFRWLAKDEV